MDDPHKDLRSLGDRMFDKRDLPIATGTSKADRTPSIAANMIRPKSFYFATDTGVLWYSDGTSWTPASNSFGPQVYFARVGNADSSSSTTFVDLAHPGPTITGLPAGSYIAIYGAVSGVSVDGSIAAMNVAVNGSGPGGPPPASGDAEARGSQLYGVATATPLALTAASNTVNAVYAVDNGAATGSWGSRWLLVFKFA